MSSSLVSGSESSLDSESGVNDENSSFSSSSSSSSSTARPPRAKRARHEDGSLLTEVTTFRDRCPDFHAQEYRLLKRPPNLRFCLDLLRSASGEQEQFINERVLLWTSETSFFALGYVDPTSYRPFYQRFPMTLCFSNNWSRQEVIHIGSLDPVSALDCLAFLVSLKDDGFKFLTLDTADNTDRGFPFETTALEIILRNNSQRRHEFCGIDFSEAQSRILATAGQETSVILSDCSFEDDGRAFVQEILAGNGALRSGPLRVGLQHELPFSATYLGQLIAEPNSIQCWRFNNVGLRMDLCQFLATRDLQELALFECDLEDHGEALISGLRSGRGPRNISFLHDSGGGSSDATPFTTLSRWKSFLETIRANESLTNLSIARPEGVGMEGFYESLSLVLRDNSSLVCLEICFEEGTVCDWACTLSSIEAHPSLLSLDFHVDSFALELESTMKKYTKLLADMLSQNRQIEKVKFYPNTYNDRLWRSMVVPLLESNIFRKRCRKLLQQSDAGVSYCALLGACLGFVAPKPWLLWTALTENQGVVAECLQHSVLPAK